MKKESPLVRLLGGKTTLFVLLVTFGVGGILLVFSKLSFLFEPFIIIFQVLFSPLIMTLVLYFILKPIVKLLGNFGLSKVASILVTLFTLCACFLLCLALVFPLLIQQIERIIEQFPNYLMEAEKVVENLLQDTRYGEIFHEASDMFTPWIRYASNNIDGYLKNIIFGATTIFSTITHSLLLMLTVPIITFFLLKNDQKFIRYLLVIFPPKHRQEIKEVVRTMNHQVGAYLKGQLIVCIIIGNLTFLGFLLISMPFSGSLALLVGLTAIVPYIGPIVAFFPCAVIALMTSPTMFLQLCVVWVVVQLLNGELIEPQVMGRHMLIHPVTIIFVLWIMGELFGLFGLIFGIPLYAVGKVVVIFVFRKFKQRYNRTYKEDPPYENTYFSLESYIKSEVSSDEE
ncbi:AI-2E family transporter [Enterococcus mundtii]|uniref:AI-2E family transporter n=1 Tax=Enterococcus mundtii TaxID=53346 RepID=A0A848N0D2_ENTMU|nr:AI-2E family transporter [Enterococcus mundtii]NMP59698.1 AI-2E family transporter [Enterococcus mundtii]